MPSNVGSPCKSEDDQLKDASIYSRQLGTEALESSEKLNLKSEHLISEKRSLKASKKMKKLKKGPNLNLTQK